MLSYYQPAYILFTLLAIYPVDSNAANFSQCLESVTSCANDMGSQQCLSSFNISNTTALSILRTWKGFPIADSSEATALTYTGCVEYCGSGQEPFSWSVFSQEFSAWLLPYLALLSQLPFGARRRTDNLMSVILTLGSPALAGYSLYLTFLNARWVNDQLFEGIDYPSAAVRKSVVQTLISLQQVPLRVHPRNSAEFESLIVHPDNDEWWFTLASELDYSHTWSIASATSIAWVIVAYLLTVVYALSNVADNINSSGEGTGSLWLWLLPIVAGWLILSPKCDYDRVHGAYNKANKRVFVADSLDPSAAPTHVNSNFGLTITPSPDWESDDSHITSPDELRIPPVFNYARSLSWSRSIYTVSLFYRSAWKKLNRRVGVDGKPISDNPIPRESRSGTRDQIIDYCLPSDYKHLRTSTLWPRGILLNMVVASLMTLLLQWGTTGAAFTGAWFTPTTGIGCRALAYLIYGLFSTLVWILLVLSSILGYYAHNLTEDLSPPEDSRSSKGTSGIGIPLREVHIEEADLETGSYKTDTINAKKYSRPGPLRAKTIIWVANLLRWAGKSLSIINAVGIIANSIFQYANVYDRCFCNSSVFTWGSSAFNVITPTPSVINLARSAWIGAVALASICCTLFVGTIYLLRDSLPSANESNQFTMSLF